MRLLIDMNLSPRWVDVLAEADLEAVHWSTVGTATAPDPELMAYARDHGYVVLTHDLDFGAILAASGGDSPSVAQIRADDLRPQAIAAAVTAALRQFTSELEQGALITIDPRRTRVRLLPLQPR